MVEPNNAYYSMDDYEDDLNNFVEAEIIEEDSYGVDGEEGEEEEMPFLNADGTRMDGKEIEEVEEVQEKDDEDDYVYDIDFSEFKGDFQSSLNGMNRAFRKKRRAKKLKLKKAKKKPLSQDISVLKRATLYGKRSKSSGSNAKTLKRVIVPSTQKVIIEGVDKFILGNDKDCDGVKNIGYYKCKKLKELILIMNNNSAVDFDLELFNPSMPLDYLQSTSLNLNNKIQVSGGITSYTDMLFNILANPTHIVNAKFTFAGAAFANQINQPLIFKNKNIEGKQTVNPLQLQLQVDTMQVAKDIVFFDIFGNLNRPFIPNGMDVIQYKVLAGCTVTFAFFYEQHDLRKLFFKEARDSKRLL